jgi:hypothetical protein
MNVIFEASCEMAPDEDSMRVEGLKRSLMFLGDDTETVAHTSVVPGRDAVGRLRDALTLWLQETDQ